MKRYRLFNFDFDTRANILNTKIEESWPEDSKKLWLENQKSTEESLVSEYGTLHKEIKIKNFKELGPAPLSIIAFHNKFFRQIRHSFVIGSYYPALTGVCALGERILNYLILSLKDDYKRTPEYKKIYNKKSFDNWGEAIKVLESWQVLLPDVASKFRDLEGIRNREAIHFNVGAEARDRELALKAIKILVDVINGQFAFLGVQPWFIEGSKGEFFIKKEWQGKPFIRVVYIPNCHLVGPFHKLETAKNGFRLVDDCNYTNEEITDEDFIVRRENFKKGI